MSSQYRCDTCSHYLKYAIACDKIKERLIVGADEWIDKVGCASHSDFQNQREKVLDEVLQLPRNREQPNGSMYIYVNDVKKLRQGKVEK